MPPEALTIPAAHAATNIHPNFRRIGLAHIRQVRRMAREGRYTADAHAIIKRAQADLLDKRQRLREPAA